MRKKITIEIGFNPASNKFTKTASTLVSATTAAMTDEQTVSLALTAGIISGLKYNGNLKRGIKAGVTTLLATALTKGVYSTIIDAKESTPDKERVSNE